MNDNVSFDIPLINCTLVTSFLSSMDGTKSTGLDCIGPRLLKLALSGDHNLRPIATRTNLYYNSFPPSVIRDWNELPVVVRQLHSVCSFKSYLNRDFTPVLKYYLTGNRKSQILHTRLRTNCRSLNNDLFLKTYLNIHYAVVVALKTLNMSS